MYYITVMHRSCNGLFQRVAQRHTMTIIRNRRGTKTVLADLSSTRQNETQLVTWNLLPRLSPPTRHASLFKIVHSQPMAAHALASFAHRGRGALCQSTVLHVLRLVHSAYVAQHGLAHTVSATLGAMLTHIERHDCIYVSNADTASAYVLSDCCSGARTGGNDFVRS